MKFNVLIVDDSSVMRKIIGRTLRQAAGEKLGEIYEAGDGAEALERLDEHDVAIVFSDVNMPKMDGLAFLRALSGGQRSGVPVVLVTTEGSERVVREAISLGAVGFVRKPFEAAQLETAIRQALERLQDAPA